MPGTGLPWSRGLRDAKGDLSASRGGRSQGQAQEAPLLELQPELGLQLAEVLSFVIRQDGGLATALLPGAAPLSSSF